MPCRQPQLLLRQDFYLSTDRVQPLSQLCMQLLSVQHSVILGYCRTSTTTNTHNHVHVLQTNISSHDNISISPTIFISPIHQKLVYISKDVKTRKLTKMLKLLLAIISLHRITFTPASITQDTNTEGRVDFSKPDNDQP